MPIKQEEQNKLASHEIETQIDFERSSILFMALVGVVSLLAITGWLIRQPLLAALRPDYIPMAPSTALLFLGICLTWFIYWRASMRRGVRILVQASLVGMLVIALLIAFRYFSGSGPDLEQWLYPAPPLFGQAPAGRSSPLTALGFCWMIIAFLILTGREVGQRAKTVSAVISLVITILGSLIFLSYAYGAPPFYGGEFIPVALTTALSFIALGLGVWLTAGPTCWPINQYVGPSLRARLMRAFVPASISIVLLQGFLSTVATPWNVNPALRVAISVLLACFIVIPIISFYSENISSEIELSNQARLIAENTLQQSEARFRTLAEMVNVAIINIDHNGQIVFWNREAEIMFGYSAGEVTGKPLSMIIPEEYRADYQQGLRRATTIGESRIIGKTNELTAQRKDGSYFPLLLSLATWQVSGDVFFTGIGNDITETKRAEKALRASEEQFRSLYENAPIGIYRTSPDGQILMANPRLVKMLGYESFEELSQNRLAREYYEPEYSRLEFKERIEQNGELLGYNAAMKCKDGSIIYVRESGHLIRGENNQPSYYEGTIEDITEQTKTGEALRKSEASLQAILQSTADGILAVGSENEVLYVNDRFAELWCIPPEIMATKDVVIALEYVRDQLSDPQSFIQKVAELNNSQAEGYDTLNFKDGRVYERFSRPLISGQAIRGRVWAFRDITERIQTDAKLEKDRILLRTLIDNIPDRIYVMDAQGYKILSNIADWQASGGKTMEDVIGKTDLDTYPPELAKKYWAANMDVINSGISILNQEEPGLDAQGNLVWVLSSKVPIYDGQGKIAGLVGVGRDITARKKAEELQDAIYRIAQATDLAASLDSLYPSIHAIIQNVMVADYLYFALYDEKWDTLSFPYYVDENDRKSSISPPIQSLTRYIIRTGLPLLATREVIDSLVQQGQLEAIEMAGEEWLGVPLKVRGRLIGVMAVQRYLSGIHFKQEDIDLLEFVSTQVAQAIERKRLEDEIRSLALTDELTGLYNRRGFTLLAEQEMRLAYRMKRDLLLLFGDVDNMKTINDTWGHAQGDLALKEISALLKQNFRESDILARIGGDEFVVMAVDAAKESAGTIASRLQAILDKRNRQTGISYPLAISLGIARFDPEASFSLSELISQADRLMYREKQARKGKV